MDHLTPKQRQQRLYLTLSEARNKAKHLRKYSESRVMRSELLLMSPKKRTLL